MDQILNYFKRRANSTVLVAYSVFWAVLHWDGLCVLLFVDQDLIMEKYGLLKNEYLSQQFFGLPASNCPCDWILAIAKFIIPFVLAYLYVWWLPKIVTNPCYRKETEYKTERRVIKMRADRKVSEEEERMTRAKTKNLEALTALAVARQENKQKDPEEAWQEEYNGFKSDNKRWRNILFELSRVLYVERGDTTGMSSNVLSVCDTNSLISFDDDRQYISLTEKGKFFLKEYNKAR